MAVRREDALAWPKHSVSSSTHDPGPGRRIGISNIVAEDALTPAQRAERGSYVGCIAGALSFSEYRTGLSGVGLTDVSVTSTHLVTHGMHSAIIKATKPMSAEPAVALSASPGNSRWRRPAVAAPGNAADRHRACRAIDGGTGLGSAIS